MIDKVNYFLKEIASLISDLHNYSAKVLKDSLLEERIQELFYSWNLNLKKQLLELSQTRKNATNVDSLLESAARLSGKRIAVKKFERIFKESKKILQNEIYVELSKQPPFLRFSEASLATELLPEIPDLPNQLIPESLVGWTNKMKRFLTEYTFDQNIFIMTRFAKKSEPIVKAIMGHIKDSKIFNAIIASDHELTDNLDNPVACLLCCRYGIAIFDKPGGLVDFNPNVAYELGVFKFLQRQCLILKSSNVKVMPSDFLHKLYKPYKTKKQAIQQLDKWLRKIGAKKITVPIPGVPG